MVKRKLWPKGKKMPAPEQYIARDVLDDVAIVSSTKYPLSLLQSVLFVGPAFTAPPSGAVRPPLLKPA